MHQSSWLSCQLARALLVLCALGLSVGCSDGYIGRECPASSPACAESLPESNAERLVIAFQEVSPDDPSPFTIKERIQNPCGSSCASERGVLLPASDGGVWTLPRAGSPWSLRLLDAASPPSVEPPALPIDSVRPFYATNERGDALVRLQWDVLRDGIRAPGPDELAILAADGNVTRVMLEAQSGVVRLPLGVLAAPSGYLLYTAARGLPLQVQLVASDNVSGWQQRKFPREASAAGGAAVSLRSGGFMLTAYQLGLQQVSLGLLQLTPGGSFFRFVVPQSSTWRNARMLPITGGGNEYALAAEADQTTIADDATGNLEIIRFAPGREPTGVRILRNCYHAMTIKGFAKDPAGNLFVSTIAGDRRLPHALLCRYSLLMGVRCFAGEPGVILEEIVATSDRTLFAVAASGDEILRIELPE